MSAVTMFRGAKRRRGLAALVLLLLGYAGAAAAQGEFTPEFGPAEPFSFEGLKARAEALAAEPFQPYEVANPELLDRIDYDAHWRINFRREATVHVGDVPLQFFHLGRFFREPVRMNVVENGQAREIVYSSDYFTMPEDSPARALEDGGFAGFRIMREDLETDWISFLGAAYFRTDGAERQYGLSARAVAIDTGLPTPEEFPRFTEFFIEESPSQNSDVIIYALLDGPSLTGAFRMVANHEKVEGQVIYVESALYFREPVQRLGIAPLTSMYWYSESNRAQAFEWRPEVHDSDGLAIVTGTGERIWRPLNNPDRIGTSSFADENVRGFGLMQRDREFASYQDDGVFYNRRPSVWVEPVGDWGEGAVHLVELPTDDEIHDNIVAYWRPAAEPDAGSSMMFNYRLYWAEGQPDPAPLARTVATRMGAGGIPGQPRPPNQIRIVIDFAGERVRDLGREDGVEPDITLGEGATLVRSFAMPVVGTDRWRLTFDVEAPPETEAVEMRAYLRRDGEALTETWLGQLHPQQIARMRTRRVGE